MAPIAADLPAGRAAAPLRGMPQAFGSTKPVRVKVECVLEIRAGGGPKGECPVWAPDEARLYWIDIDGGTLNRFDPASGLNQVFELGEPIGCFARHRSGGFVLALKSGIWLAGHDPRERTMIAPAPRPAQRPNDGRCDRLGRFWFGTMRDPPDTRDRSDDVPPDGALWLLDAAASPRPVVDGLFVPNGLAFTPDGRTMYQSDSFARVRTVWRWDLDIDGLPSNRRPFIVDVGGGRPDGACIDADGCYWSCRIDAGKVIRYTPEGAIDLVIDMPVRWPTMCAFGGPGLETLFITSLRRGGASSEHPDQPLAGSLFACRPGVRGLAEPSFAG